MDISDTDGRSRIRRSRVFVAATGGKVKATKEQRRGIQSGLRRLHRESGVRVLCCGSGSGFWVARLEQGRWCKSHGGRRRGSQSSLLPAASHRSSRSSPAAARRARCCFEDQCTQTQAGSESYIAAIGGPLPGLPPWPLRPRPCAPTSSRSAGASSRACVSFAAAGRNALAATVPARKAAGSRRGHGVHWPRSPQLPGTPPLFLERRQADARYA